MRYILRFYIPLAVWLLISTILLTLPGSAFPKEDWLSKIWFDKWVHIGMFGIMTVLACWSLWINSGSNKGFLTPALLCLAYGIGMEFVQRYFVANRSFDFGDIIADAIGVWLGYWFSWYRYKK